MATNKNNFNLSADNTGLLHHDTACFSEDLTLLADSGFKGWKL
jgi:hypothetical protein